ncbi:MAG: rhomboid family intramembrane serine protease [Ferruginibacter sp.]
MAEVGITTLIFIIANIFCSLQGLSDRSSFERNNFDIDKIYFQKDYKRLVTSSFFHVSGIHLILNMATLCFFSGGIELQLGEAKYLFIYFASLVGGNLFSLFIYRNRRDYTAAVGASGGVSGIIFATIVLYPGFEIGFLGTHFPIPAWFYGFMYVLFSIYGIKSKKDNIGHEAYLAGGLAGLIIAVVMQPSILATNYLTILAVAIPTVFFIFITVTMPRFIMIGNKYFDDKKNSSKTKLAFYAEGVDHEQEIDFILEKIHQNGIESLTNLEKEKLDYYSKIIQ